MNPFTKTEVDPVYSKEEMALNGALESAISMAALPVEQAVLFPPRFGLRRGEAISVSDVLAMDRYAGPDRRFDYSGGEGRYSGTARPGIGNI